MEDYSLYFPYIEHKYKPQKSNLFWSILQLYFKIQVKQSSQIQTLNTMPRRNKDDPSFVYISRHRSHFDYALLVSHLMTKGRGVISQAGDNLFIGPLDKFLRNHGAFKVFRIENNNIKIPLYSPNWFENKKLEKLGKEPKYFVTKKKYRRIYESYITHLIQEGYDLQIFPEYEGKKTKTYGRSKTGYLNQFSPYIFNVLLKASSKRPVFIIPTNISYERVLEDFNLHLVQKIKKKFGSSVAYSYDLLYNAFSFININRKKPRANISFGIPFELENNSFKLTTSLARKYSEKAREEVSLLELPYPSQLVASALFLDFQKNGKFEKVPISSSITSNELFDRIAEIRHNLKKKEIDSSFIEDDLESIVKRATKTLRSFFDNALIQKRNNSYYTLDSEILSHYANHIGHLLK